MTFFERLQGSHEVVTASDAVRDNSLSDTGCDGAFDDGGDGIHGAHDFGLELGWDMEFDLLEEVF
jgi:hypothetical protein